MISAILAAFVLLAGSTPAAPPAPAPALTAPTKAKAADDPNALVCKSEPVLGSRLATKRCRTVADIAQRKLDDRAALERVQVRQDAVR
ncbi:hypothetical protein [Phenylobacterium sp.]|uniref:hypothetical protein n=1 Tax=Phenylobacterium sp. TaxID=1871053 RepID=UPI00286A6D1E|nr:hypothetical protein [Phenylobacterium sp.]